MSKSIKILLLLVTSVYLLICVYLFYQQKNLVYFPQHEDRNFTKQFTHAEINFAHQGETLHGWMQIDKVNVVRPLVIYYGGNGEEVSYNQQWFKEIGIQNYVLLNYRGYGRSTGVPDETWLKNDALFVFDKVTKNNNIEASSVILIGRSLGTGVATYVASQREVGKVVLITPYDSLVKVAGSHYPILPVSLLMNQRFESDTLASRIDAPVLCLIAEKDQVIPPVHAKNLCGLWKGETSVTFIQNVGHMSIFKHPEFYRSIRNYLLE